MRRPKVPVRPPRKKSKTHFFTSLHMMKKGVHSPVIFHEGENRYESDLSGPVWSRLFVLLLVLLRQFEERLLEQLRMRQFEKRLLVRLRLR